MYKWKEIPVSLALVGQFVYEKECPIFKPAALCLKIDLVTHPTHGAEVG